MAGVSSLTNIWNTIREIDLRPLREDALRLVKIAIVGMPGSGRARLAEQMRRDLIREDIELQTPVMILNVEESQGIQTADLIILMAEASASSLTQEKALAQKLANSGKRVLIFINQAGEQPEGSSLSTYTEWGRGRLIYGPVDDRDFLAAEFVPAVLDLLPDDLLPLGRNFPLFRLAIANRIINETCFSNATYSLSTGVAEIVPAIGIPLNVADMVVLTKTQAFLVYKLGLSLGLSTDWQDYLSEFGGVLGGGFLWRQIARSLVGLIPAWGIIPKVAVAYAGTYVVGHTVLQWYQTGRHVSRKQMQELYGQAFARGKAIARNLLSRTPRLRLGRRRVKALPAPKNSLIEAGQGGRSGEEILISPHADEAAEAGETLEGLNALGPSAPVKPAAAPSESSGASGAWRTCPVCGQQSASDAQFCQYCGTAF